MHSIHQTWLLLALLLAWGPTADSWGQTDLPIPWECGNDPLQGREEELVAARRKMQQRQADELAPLTKDSENIDWRRVVELRKQHIRQWHKWFAKQKQEHPKWPFLSDEAERQEERIRYQTNTAYLYYHEETLRQKPPRLVSASALASAWNVWPNQPYPLCPDAAHPEKNVVPRGGPTTTTNAYVHLASACILARVEFELVGIPESEMRDGKELTQVHVSFHASGIFTRWKDGRAVATVPEHVRPGYPYEVSIHGHRSPSATSARQSFTAKNIRIYGWTLDEFPFEDKRPRAVTSDQAKAKASETCKSEVHAGTAKAIAMKYLVREHLRPGMTRGQIEAVLGDAPDERNKVVYHARAGANIMDKKSYATLTISYRDNIVTLIELVPVEEGKTTP